MKRVVVLNQFAVPRSEGGGTRHIDLFGRLAGWDPVIVCGDRSHATQRRYGTDDGRFRLVRVPGHRGERGSRVLGWGVYALKAFAVAATRRHVRVVYGSSPHLLAPLAGLLAARLRGARFVLEVRDLWPESIVAAGAMRAGTRLHRLLCGLERLLARAADAIVVVTPGWEDHFAELGVDLNRVFVIPNGTEVSDFEVSGPREEVRKELGLTRFTAVYAGAHNPANSLDLLLDAARALPEMDFLLIGAGTQKEPLRRRAHSEAIDNVRFLDPVPKSELTRLLPACDVGVHCIAPLPLLDKGMSPNKLFDYLAAGLPTVSNAREGLRTVFRDGECGHLGGPDSLAESLRKVHETSPERRRAWGAHGRTVVENRFSRRAAAAQLQELLDAVAGPRAAGAAGPLACPEVVHVTTAHRATDNRILRKECTSLVEAGVRLALVAPAPRSELINGVPVVALPRHGGRLSRMVVGPVDVWRTLRRLRPRVVHVHDPELIPLAVLWRLGRGRKAVFDSHEDLPKQVMGKHYIPGPFRKVVARFAGRLEALADRRLDAVVATTPSIARNFTHAPVVLVQNYPWLRDYPTPAAWPATDRPTVVYVGGITIERGIVEMVEAIRQSRHGARLVLAGPVTAAAREVIERADGDRVRYLGVLPASQVPEVVAQAHVGLLAWRAAPNHLESQPTKLFEYLAAGRPFVASDFPYWRSLIGDVRCGLFTPAADAAALRDSIDLLIDDHEAAREMGARGRLLLEKFFTFEQEADKLHAMTGSLLDGDPGTGRRDRR